MSDIINLLPDSVANQIAAGEVVDRPASAVKELLENAMDAGASKIQLIIKDAGRTLIQVIDNGCGMSSTDARRCFERHATSKIKEADDLFAIRTMGFRGEALASIAAVAQVELKTKQIGEELGTCVIIEGSDVKTHIPCSCNNGTSIAVKNLFFNIPARRNFLKKDSIEFSHIEEIFRRVAIMNSHVAFSFVNNGKTIYELPAGNLAQRLSSLFGDNFNQKLYPIEEHTDVGNIKGYVGKPEHARKTRGEQYLFVNGRFIKHIGLSAAIEKAYIDMIPERYYPSYFVNIDVDPSRIDVNIHPTKTEVRFIDEQTLFAILRSATKKAIGQFTLATELEFNPSMELPVAPAPSGYVPEFPNIHHNPAYNPFSGGGKSKSHGSSFSSITSDQDNGRWKNFFEEPENSKPAFTGIPETPFSPANESSENQTIMSGIIEDDSNSNGQDSVKVNTNSVIQFQNRFIITTLKSGLLIVDQQRAHERILYERLLSKKQSGGSQNLLFPVNCQFSPSDSDMINEILPDLKDMGFEIELLGKNTFVVTAIPTNIKEIDLQNVLDQMIQEYKGSMLQKFSNREHSICLALSHQMAVKNGTPLKSEEIQQLLADLFSCQVPNLSPSGKKTLMVMSEEMLSEKFK